MHGSKATEVIGTQVSYKTFQLFLVWYFRLPKPKYQLNFSNYIVSGVLFKNFMFFKTRKKLQQGCCENKQFSHTCKLRLDLSVSTTFICYLAYSTLFNKNVHGKLKLITIMIVDIDIYRTEYYHSKYRT